MSKSRRKNRRARSREEQAPAAPPRRAAPLSQAQKQVKGRNLRAAILRIMRFAGELHKTNIGPAPFIQYGPMRAFLCTPHQNRPELDPEIIAQARAAGYEHPEPYRYVLDVWFEHTKVFGIHWDEADGEMLLRTWKRGAWEDELIAMGRRRIAARPTGLAELKAQVDEALDPESLARDLEVWSSPAVKPKPKRSRPAKSTETTRETVHTLTYDRASFEAFLRETGARIDLSRIPANAPAHIRAEIEAIDPSLRVDG